MEALLATLEAAGWVEALRASRWSYAVVNTGHVLGIGLLVGAVVPLDLRLLGVWRDVPQPFVARILVPVAALGLALAVATGLLLFSIRAREYAGLAVFQAKLGLVAAGTVAAIVGHLRHGGLLDGGSRGTLALHGGASLSCWLSALVCGRFIAFSGE